MYVELISSFHICGITINASEWDPVHVFAGESEEHTLTWLCGASRGTWSAEDTAWRKWKMQKMPWVTGEGIACFDMCCKLPTQDK